MLQFGAELTLNAHSMCTHATHPYEETKLQSIYPLDTWQIVKMKVLITKQLCDHFGVLC